MDVLFTWGAEQRLTTSHFSTSLAAVKAGLGFAFMPEHWVATEISAGQLRHLPLAQNTVRVINLFLVVPDGNLAGKATDFLRGALVKLLG
jgi:DNA-binding transcriptional LysR family regulator